MLLDLREKIRNSKVLKYVIITAICIPFAAFGIGSYLERSGNAYAAKVNGEDVPLRDFDQALRQQRFRLQQMFGGNIPEGFVSDEALRRQAAESLVSERVLADTVLSQKFIVSDATLVETIRNIPSFQVEGQFDFDLYSRWLQSQGMSETQFEEGMRQDAAISQFRDGISRTAFVLPAEKARSEKLLGQIRTVDTVTFSMEDAKAGLEVTDEEAGNWFGEHADQFRFPERVKIEYLDLSADALVASIDVSDEEAREWFDSNSHRYRVPEERAASHILLQVDGNLDTVVAQAGELKSRIEAGEDFAALAGEFSTDLGSAEQGGSLGQFGRGAMVPPFEEAVYSMTEIGQLSEPVQTDFGVHLIRLDEILPERGKTFEEMHEEIVSEIRQSQAGEDFLSLQDLLSEHIFDFPESLESAATETGLAIQSSDWLDAETPREGSLASPDVLRAALSDEVLTEGNNSELIEIGDRHVLALRVTDHEDARPKTLDDVKDQVIDSMKTERAGEQLDTAVESLKSSLGGEQGLADLASQANAVLAENIAATRQGAELDRAASAELFKLPHPSADAPSISSVVLANGDRLLMLLRSVADPEAPVAESGEDNSGTESVADPRSGNVEFSLLLEGLRSTAEVEFNEQLMADGNLGQ